MLKIDQIINSEKTLHSSPSWVSYGVSFGSILENTYHVKKWFIYIADHFHFQEGLVKSNMDKLTFFAMKSPEKLDRIGEYLAQRLSRDVSRNRIGWVDW